MEDSRLPFCPLSVLIEQLNAMLIVHSVLQRNAQDLHEHEGDALIERYKDACPAVLDFRERPRSSEQQIGEGGTVSFAEMQKKMREKHGL